MQLRRWAAARCAICALVSTATATLVGCGGPADGATFAPSPAAPTAPAIAQEHVDAARELASDGNLSAAVVEYSAALDAMRETAGDPTIAVDPDILFARGMAFLEMGFPDTAAADFSDVLRVRPDDGLAYARRGEAYAKLGDFFKAVRDCTQAIRHEPQLALAYRYRGEAYLARGQFDRAAADLDRAVALDGALTGDLSPKLAAAYRGWGDELADAGDAESAAAKLAKVREFDPTATDVAAAEAHATPVAGDDAVRQTAAKEVIDAAREHYEQGLVHWNAGRHDDAVASLTAAIEARPGYAEAYLSRGRALLALGFPDTAVMDFEQAINFGAATPLAYRFEAEAFLQLDNPHRTVMSAGNALHIDPLDAAAYALRGKGYVALGKWDRGLADLNAAIRLDPQLAVDVASALEVAHRLRDAAQASDLRNAMPEA